MRYLQNALYCTMNGFFEFFDYTILLRIDRQSKAMAGPYKMIALEFFG